MLLNLGDHGISTRLLLTKGKREPCFWWIINKEAFGTGLDIGANIGFYTLVMAKKCDKVLAFEPDERSYDILEQNIRLNKLKNVVCEKKAISDVCGKVSLFITKRPNLCSLEVPNKEVINKKTVKTISIDSLNEEIDFVKMDIEGAETAAIRGGLDTFAKRNCKIIIELHPEYYNNKNNFKAILKSLLELGYRIKYVVNAKGRMKDFLKKGYKPVKKIRNFPRAVFKNIPEDRVLRWATKMPSNGKKYIRSILLVKK